MYGLVVDKIIRLCVREKVRLERTKEKRLIL